MSLTVPIENEKRQENINSSSEKGFYTCGIRERILDCRLYCGRRSKNKTISLEGRNISIIFASTICVIGKGRIELSYLYTWSRMTRVFLHVKKMFMWEIT